MPFFVFFFLLDYNGKQKIRFIIIVIISVISKNVIHPDSKILRGKAHTFVTIQTFFVDAKPKRASSLPKIGNENTACFLLILRNITNTTSIQCLDPILPLQLPCAYQLHPSTLFPHFFPHSLSPGTINLQIRQIKKKSNPNT